jgi:hypothetical protein
LGSDKVTRQTESTFDRWLPDIKSNMSNSESVNHEVSSQELAADEDFWADFEGPVSSTHVEAPMEIKYINSTDLKRLNDDSFGECLEEALANNRQSFSSTSQAISHPLNDVDCFLSSLPIGSSLSINVTSSAESVEPNLSPGLEQSDSVVNIPHLTDSSQTSLLYGIKSITDRQGIIDKEFYEIIKKRKIF